MKCPRCGYVSFDPLECCKRCGAPMSPGTAAPPAAAGVARAATATPDRANMQVERLRLDPERSDPERPTRGGARRRRTPPKSAGPAPGPVEMLDDDALQISEEDLASRGERAAHDDGTPFHIDEDLFNEPGAAATPSPGGDVAVRAEPWRPLVVELPEPTYALDDEVLPPTAGGDPVIDRDDEIPERFWAPEIAGLGRRAAALFVDQALLALLLGIFFVAAFLGLRFSGFDTDQFLAASGLRAALLPFALLAVVLSLAYQVFFFGYIGRTPGKAFAGVEVRTADGAVPSWGRLLARWFCATLGLAAAGAGLAWALFEPRRRGWADLLSGTVIARRPARTAAVDIPPGPRVPCDRCTGPR